MRVIRLYTQIAFIEVEDGEEYPPSILVNVDRRRIFKKYVCSKCNKIFYSRKIRKFCSKKCFDESRNVELVCHGCNKKFTRATSHLKNAKHGIYFCSRECKEKAQGVDGNCPEIRPAHYRDGKSRYAIRARNLQNYCDICDEKDEDYLLVHHIDGDRENNRIENLRVLCANCHLKGHRTGIWKKANN